jgi:hypothetical protein
MLYNTRLILGLDDVQINMEHIARAVPSFKSIESMIPNANIIARLLATLQSHVQVLRHYHSGLTHLSTSEQAEYFNHTDEKKNLWEGFSNQTIHNKYLKNFVSHQYDQRHPRLVTDNNNLNNRETLRISNLIDLDLVPINTASFMRSVPFANLLNFSQGFDEYFGKLFHTATPSQYTVQSYLTTGRLPMVDSDNDLESTANAYSHLNSLKFTNQFPGLVGRLMAPTSNQQVVTGGRAGHTVGVFDNYMHGFYIYKCMKLLCPHADYTDLNKSIPSFIRYYEKFFDNVVKPTDTVFGNRVLKYNEGEAPEGVDNYRNFKYTSEYTWDKFKSDDYGVLKRNADDDRKTTMVIKCDGSVASIDSVKVFITVLDKWVKVRGTIDSESKGWKDSGNVGDTMNEDAKNDRLRDMKTILLPYHQKINGFRSYFANPFTAESFLGWVTVAQESIQRIVATQALYVKSAVETGHKTLMSDSLTQTKNDDIDVWSMNSVIHQ